MSGCFLSLIGADCEGSVSGIPILHLIDRLDTVSVEVLMIDMGALSSFSSLSTFTLLTIFGALATFVLSDLSSAEITRQMLDFYST